MRDERTMDFIAARGIPLEVCPTSNLRTGALARQLGRKTAGYEQHPLASFFRRGLPVTLSSDDPAMFETTVNDEYVHAHHMGLNSVDLVRLAEQVSARVLPEAEKAVLLDEFHSRTAALGLV